MSVHYQGQQITNQSHKSNTHIHVVNHTHSLHEYVESLEQEEFERCTKYNLCGLLLTFCTNIVKTAVDRNIMTDFFFKHIVLLGKVCRNDEIIPQ